MNKSNNILKTIENPGGDIIWNGIEIEKLFGSRVDIIGSECNETPELQEIFTSTKR